MNNNAAFGMREREFTTDEERKRIINRENERTHIHEQWRKKNKHKDFSHATS